MTDIENYLPIRGDRQSRATSPDLPFPVRGSSPRRWVAALAVLIALAGGCGGAESVVDSGPPGPPPPPPPTSPNREWTVMVYMAADNNLAVQGIRDIDEIEAAGRDPKVQVVVEAEFSPTVVKQLNCDPSCFHRPNYNTFRYAVNGQAPHVVGPDGDAIDLGNRNMTDPAQLREFVTWSKQQFPAKRYLLVLWNHGGGYVGLLQDETSAAGTLMSLADLRAALTGAGGIDLVDFDMCLMAGYETLVKLSGLADYAVFSEQTAPGEGNPYDAIVKALNVNPTATPRDVAAMIVDQYHASFQGNQASTTLSAYEVGRVTGFESALNTFAEALEARLPSLGPALGPVIRASQKFDYPELTDIGDFLRLLRAQTVDPALLGSIDALAGQLQGSFRIANRARNGSGRQAQPVDRSTGLNIVLPSNIGSDRLGDAGPRSLAAYERLNPGTPWTRFLKSWLAGVAMAGHTDQGDQRFETYLVWDPDAVDAGADLDLLILEPSGKLYAPALGSVTPNGALSNDSDADQVNFEGYLTNRFVENGDYKFYALLFRDDEDFRPRFDLVFRASQTEEFGSLFEPDYPELSLDRSIFDDPDPTDAKIEAGAYTDFRMLASLSYGGANLNRRPTVAVAPRSAPTTSATAAPGSAGPRITAAQIETVTRLLADRRGRTANASKLTTRPPAFGGARR